MEGSGFKLTYSYFHLLKKYQETVPCELEQVTLKDLESFIFRSGKEETEHDVHGTSYSSYGSNGCW